MSHSVQLSSDGIDQRVPRLHEGAQLRRLSGMRFSDILENDYLIRHQGKIGNRPLTCSRHFSVAVQSLAGQHNALVGFGGGHRRTLCHS